MSGRLLAFERRWAEALFDAVLGIGAAGDLEPPLPAFESIDRAVFWRALEDAPAPSFRLGLRAFVYALTFWPLLDRRWRRPFFRLARADRCAVIEALDRRTGYLPRQSLAAVKMLACFAYFDAPEVRAAFEPSAATRAERVP